MGQYHESIFNLHMCSPKEVDQRRPVAQAAKAGWRLPVWRGFLRTRLPAAGLAACRGCPRMQES